MQPPHFIEQKLNYTFRDPQLLERALTHSSFAHENGLGELGDNEQLEFLGDAVVGFVVSDLLVRRQTNLDEGRLSKTKGFLVSAANLVRFADRLELGQHLRLGRGEEKTGGRSKQGLLVDAFEAVIGALYLDGGIAVVTETLAEFFGEQIFESSSSSRLAVADFKTALASIAQGRNLGAVHYAVGRDAAVAIPAGEAVFLIDVRVGDETLGAGMGLTRKAAEQAAARNALGRLENGAGIGAGNGTK